MDRLFEGIVYFGQLIDILCIICTIIGCFGGVILNNRDDGPNSKNKVRRFLLWMLAIVSLVILALNKFGIPNLTKVPEIENCVLDSAKIMLSQRELSYVITNAYEYQDQDPLLYKVSLNNNEANTYTKKGTAVELKIIGIEKVDVYDSVDWDSLKVREPGEVEIDPNIQKVDLCVDLRECMLNEISAGEDLLLL